MFASTLTPVTTREGILVEAGQGSPESARNTPVYVVDDEPMVAEVLQAILQMAGFQARIFQEPELALQGLIEAEVCPRLLITDYAMDGMNGLELIQACKMVRPGLKTILATSSVGCEATATYSLKPDCFLIKPFQPEVFLHTVRQVLAV